MIARGRRSCGRKPRNTGTNPRGRVGAWRPIFPKYDTRNWTRITLVRSKLSSRVIIMV